MAKQSTIDRYKSFWVEFAGEADDLHHLVFSGYPEFVYQRVKRLEGKHRCLFCTELSSSGPDLLLIFTPEWDDKVAKKIDLFLSQAPSIRGWQLYGRRQEKPLADAFALTEQVFTVDARDAGFLLHRGNDGYAVTMITSVAERIADVDREAFVKFFLSHAIGEELTMRLVKVARVVGPTPGTSPLSPAEFFAALRHNLKQDENG